MFSHYLIAIGGVALLMTIWIVVQSAWRKSFNLGRDEDVLAGRDDCHGCSHHGRCEKQTSGHDHSHEAEACDLRSELVEHKV